VEDGWRCDSGNNPNACTTDPSFIQTTTNTDYDNRSEAGALDCTNGEVLTGVGYSEVPGSISMDAVDGFAIACSPYNRDGTLGGAGSFITTSDISSVDVQLRCNNQPVVGLMTKDLIRDMLDGVTVDCASIVNGTTGPSNRLRNSDIDGSTYPSVFTTCPPNMVAVGLTWDDLNLETNPDTTDSVRLKCRPLQCSNS
jgi:hypothetical protein